MLHEKVLLVAVEMTETPRVTDEERVRITPISDDMTRVELRFGFMEVPDVPPGTQSRGGAPADCTMRFGAGDLLYRSRNNHSDRPADRYGPVAQSDVCDHASQRSAARRLFQYTERPDYGNRRRV